MRFSINKKCMKMSRTILLGLFFYLSSQLPGQAPIRFYDCEDNANRSTTLKLTPGIIINTVTRSTVSSTGFSTVADLTSGIYFNKISKNELGLSKK